MRRNHDNQCGVWGECVNEQATDTGRRWWAWLTRETIGNLTTYCTDRNKATAPPQAGWLRWKPVRIKSQECDIIYFKSYKYTKIQIVRHWPCKPREGMRVTRCFITYDQLYASAPTSADNSPTVETRSLVLLPQIHVKLMLLFRDKN